MLNIARSRSDSIHFLFVRVAVCVIEYFYESLCLSRLSSVRWSGVQLLSYIQLLQPFRKAVRVDSSAMGATNGVRPPVGLAPQPMQDVFEGSVVHLVLVQQLLFTDSLRLRF